MPKRESGNHEAEAFSLGLPPSSQNGSTRLRSCKDTLSNAWAIGLVLWILLSGSLLADVSAFTRVAAQLDRPVVVWLEAVFGYLCIVSVSLNLSQRLKAVGFAPASLALSVLAFASYGYHLFLLRWTWLSGAAESTARYTVWSALLSSTWRGVPVLAFGELLAIMVLLIHGFVGLTVTAPWRQLTRESPRLRIGLVAVGLVTYIIASAVVITLATGRR